MTTKADTSVKWFHFNMADAPVSSTANGALVAMLDACLVNGFSVRTPDSVVVVDGVATVSIGAGNPYEKHTVIAISGSSVGALNAEWRIADSGATTFSFVCPGVPDGVATGASIKRAPAGWLKPFADTNVGVYQSADPVSTQLYLQVDDRYGGACRVRGYEQMTGALTGAGEFPRFTSVSDGGLRWPKSSQNDWVIIADGSFVWLILRATTNPASGRLLNHFGDIKPYIPGDRYHCTICGAADSNISGAGHPGSGSNNSTSVHRRFARESNQVSQPIYAHQIATLSHSQLWADSLMPIASDGVYRFGSKVFARSDGVNSNVLRGELPGPISSFTQVPFTDLQVVEVAGRVFLAVDANTAFNGAGRSVTTFEIVGPWR